MALPFYLWSRTAADNDDVASPINWTEGQLPSTVNDSGRAMMAQAAAFRDDIAGAIATGGTSTAYTVTSYQIFDSLSHLNGQVIAFTPHTTNGNTVTLNVDGLGAKPLRSAPGVELIAGTLVAGTPYACLYNSSSAVFYLINYFVNPYNVPIGSILDYSGTTAPNSSFALCYGQAISQSTYATLYAIQGANTFGADSGGNFLLPDCRGRVIAGKDDMGGSSANRLTNADDGLNGDTMGATGGGETQVMVQANLPNVNFTVASGQTVSVSGTLSRQAGVSGGGVTGLPVSASAVENLTMTSTGTVTSTGTAASGGSGTAFGVVQPTIILSKIIRII